MNKIKWTIYLMGFLLFTPLATHGLAQGGDVYIVQPGDSLSKIAQDKLGDYRKWNKIYEANKDIISEPNLIYPGWKLKLATTPPLPPETKEQVREKITKHMFRSSNYEYEDEVELVKQLLTMQTTLFTYRYDGYSIYQAKTVIMEMQKVLPRLELHALARCIMESAEDHDKAYLLTALGTIETHFRLRRGNLGERGFFQIMPNTVRRMIKLPEFAGISYEEALSRVEYDVKFAVNITNVALGILLKDNNNSSETALLRWNGSREFPPKVMKVYYQLRRR